jgi:hypothetical protein
LTLVLHIPFNQGCLLIADRQETYDDGSKTNFTKLCSYGDNGPAMGCAGGSDLIRKLFSEVKTIDFSIVENPIKTVKERLEQSITEARENAKLIGPGIDPTQLRVEFFFVEIQEGTISSKSFNCLWGIKEMDGNIINALPENNKDVKEYLIDTSSFSKDKAKRLGVEILRQVSLRDSTVGAPEYHGYDVIEITNSGKFSFYSKPAIYKRCTITELLTNYVTQQQNNGEEQ